MIRVESLNEFANTPFLYSLSDKFKQKRRPYHKSSLAWQNNLSMHKIRD
jgi:hypothetical protein